MATRYLRVRHTRSARLHGITLVLTALLVILFAASWYLDHGRSLKLQELRDDWGKPLATAQLVLLIVTVLVEVFLRFARPFCSNPWPCSWNPNKAFSWRTNRAQNATQVAEGDLTQGLARVRRARSRGARARAP